MQVQRTIKRREGVWGIVKGDKGGASQVAPLSPLTKKAKNRIMSNGESKIAIFKAALCCGFAIALRALFLVIPIVIASVRKDAWQSTSKESQRESQHV